MRLAAAVACLALAGCAVAPAREGARPAAWAVPIAAPALPNLHRVSPTLLRGAQPEPAGYRELERLGVRTVVSLRQLTRDVLPAGSRLTLIEIPMLTWAPSDAQVAEFLRIATDPSRQPVFVHCHHGADRTGLVCAVYRVAVEGWSKEEALAELQSGGFGYHPVWDELPAYLRKLDVEHIRALADLPRYTAP